MDAASLDQTTFDYFKQKLTTDFAEDQATVQEVITAAIAEAQTKATTYVLLTTTLAAETFTDLVTYSAAHPEYTPVGVPAQDSFNLAKAKTYAELNAAATATLAEQQELDRVGAAQYDTYAMMLAYIGSLNLAALISYMSSQPGYDPLNPPTEDTFDATMALLLATVQARQTNDLAANQLEVNALLAKGATYTAQATALNVTTYTDFTDWIAAHP